MQIDNESFRAICTELLVKHLEVSQLYEVEYHDYPVIQITYIVTSSEMTKLES